jgi:glycosyltransferase involved in cell wall biosynthesis
MKILQLIQKKQARGAEIHAALLSNLLLKEGIDVEMMALLDGDFDLGFEGRIHLLHAKLQRRFFDYGAWAALARYIKESETDLIQANGADTLKYAVFSKILFGWKAEIIFYNGSQVSQYIKNPLKRYFNRLLYKQVDRVVAVSREVSLDYSKVFPGLHQDQKTIPAGIQLPSVSLPEAVGYPLYAHIGGFTFEKNHEGLLRIFSQIKANKPQAELWLFGEGPLKESIKRKVGEMGLEQAVVFKGAVHFPYRYIPKNAIILLPSRIEGLPAVVLESLALGYRTLVYATGSLEELYRDLDLEDIVEFGDEKGFVQKALSLSTAGPVHTESLREKILMRFGLENQLPKWKEVYHSMKKS